ncbi:hypothetical protein QQS21_002837 [Conoideocrella luteorostrata]|uniref:Uncharacterized protein n=1 Tax=Conoideocrella luteorostrata TaxID=1105319 RepID=A0AAJ0CUH1_9HYPO|nr:hypothetical protein QQS21_002837 [Conoideocrella luteorostrata]
MQRPKDAAAVASRPNGRGPHNELLVSHESRRPLFTSHASRALGGRGAEFDVRSATASLGLGTRSGGLGAEAPGLARRAKSDPQGAASDVRLGYDPNASSASLLSPGGSRIPRPHGPGLQGRRPISLAEAFQLAQEEEEEAERQRQLGGSPSPAPRPWRARPGQAEDEMQARQLLAEDHLDNKARARQSTDVNRQSEQSPNTKSRPVETGSEANQSGRPRNGLSLQERINEWRTKSRPASNLPRAQQSPEFMGDSSGDGRLPDLVPGIEDVPLPSVESSERNFGIAPPGDDFTWQVDQDFTAGDLQVSDSPRIKVGIEPFANRPSIFDKIEIRSPAGTNSPRTRNTKLEEIRAREAKLGATAHAAFTGLTERQQPRRYAQLEEIRAREAAAEKQFPIPDRNQPRKKNMKLDDIRKREAEGLSKRAVAAARLAEIKEKNAMTRSLSPDSIKLPTGRENRELGVPARPKSAFESGGERIPDTPVTIFKSYRSKQENLNPNQTWVSGDTNTVVNPDTVNERDLLRRLARAASASPATEPATEPANKQPIHSETQKHSESDKPVTKPSLTGRFTNHGRKSAFIPSSKSGSANINSNNSNNTKANESQTLKPRVGFSGLQRANSTESVKSKRSGMISDSDPTARIEAEAELFAPGDYYSEPGSVRAPSPEPDSEEEAEDEKEEELEKKLNKKLEQDDAAEATPKPQRYDFQSMPTPQVTGAYVETPVTAVKGPKVTEDEQEEQRDIKPFNEKLKEQKERERKQQEEHKGKQDTHKSDAPSLFRDKKASVARKSRDEEDAASDPGSRSGRLSDEMSSSVAAGKKRRSRSLPRKRPPLKNSAKLPTVKDDLRELQRQHNIDDSTVDDLEDILTGRKHAAPQLKQLLEELPVKSEDAIDRYLKAMDDEVKQEPVSDDQESSEGQSTLVEKMRKTVRSGLSNIREAKLGIERLEDQFTQARERPSTKTKATTTSSKPHIHTKQLLEQKVSHKEQCPECITDSQPMTATYLHLRMPPLYQTTPRFRLTLLGLLITIILSWYVGERAMCAKYCRPTTCGSAPCVYSYDDPTFGNALPVKLDQWVMSGHGRIVANWVAEEVQDWMADVKDVALGRSLQDVAVDRLNAEERRQHRRRLRKRGLLKPSPQTAASDQKAKWDAWKRSRLAKERAQEARDAGYDTRNRWAEDDSIGGDERLW